MTPVLLHTKFQLPHPRPSLIHRPALLEKLSGGLQGKLTLVSAPAGFGKTTLLTDFINHTARSDPAVRWGWLSLDSGDNDPARFFAYIIAALQTAEPDTGQPAADLLTSPQLTSLEPIITILSNELGQLPFHLALVLEDYHFITNPTIHRAIAFWLDHLPSNFHLILTSRADPPFPLPRLRVAGQLLEIRSDDLRFTTEEVARFLHQMLDQTLSPQEIAALEQRTEGWVAGLQLAALSIQGQSDVTGFIRAFTGSHVYILDYLVDEVLQQQPPDVIRFLQETAVLDQLYGPLCAALTGRSDSETLLRHLHKSNLFLQALDDNLDWFRFHALFREVLLVQLQNERADDLPLLHGRAAQWFAQHGQMTLALHHTFAAGDLNHAADMIEQHAETYLDRGEYITIRSWLEQLPHALRHTSPRLTLIEGTILTVTGSMEGAEQLLAKTAALFQSADLPPALLGERALLQLTTARFQGRMEEAIEYGRQALALLPEERRGPRNKVLANLILAYYLKGDMQSLDALLPEIKDDNTETYLVLAFGFPFIHYYRGQLEQARKGYQQILDRAARMKKRPIVALSLAHSGLGDIAYERDNLPQAIHHLEQALGHLKNTIEQITLARTAAKLALALLASGEKTAVFTPIDDISDWLEKMRLADLGFSIVLDYQRANVYLQMGDVDAAGRAVAAHQLPDLTIGRSEEFLIHARLLLAQNQPHAALQLLNQIDQEAALRKWNGMQVEINCQRALAWTALGDHSKALAALTAVLPLAQREDYRRVFLDKGPAMADLLAAARRQGISPHYLDTLLAAFTPDSAPQNTALPDPLSEREMELLALVATGASNKEIAAQLFISVSTVKKHIGNIFVKLDVDNRTEATARARELRLL